MAHIIADSSLWWHNGEVSYVVPLDFPENLGIAVLDAIKTWSDATKFNFRPHWKSVPGTRELRFEQFASDYCSASIKPEGATVSCSMQTTRTLLHEIGHALGFLHEHTRPDRDEHVLFNLNNVRNDPDRREILRQFDIDDSGIAIGSYEISSLMHYKSVTFATEGTSALTSRSPSVPDSDLGKNTIIGQSEIEGAEAMIPYYMIELGSLTCNATDDGSGDGTDSINLQYDIDGLRSKRKDPGLQFTRGETKTLRRRLLFRESVVVHFNEYDATGNDYLGHIVIRKPRGLQHLAAVDSDARYTLNWAPWGNYKSVDEKYQALFA